MLESGYEIVILKNSLKADFKYIEVCILDNYIGSVNIYSEHI